MLVRNDISIGEPRGKWADLFGRAKNGSSVHAKDMNEVSRVTSSFRYWKQQTGSNLSITRRAVDGTDPEGPGFRIWFIAPNDIGAG